MSLAFSCLPQNTKQDLSNSDAGCWGSLGSCGDSDFPKDLGYHLLLPDNRSLHLTPSVSCGLNVFSSIGSLLGIWCIGGSAVRLGSLLGSVVGFCGLLRRGLWWNSALVRLSPKRRDLLCVQGEENARHLTGEYSLFSLLP